MDANRNLYVAVSQSTIMYSILNNLGASDSASFMHAFGIRHTTFLKTTYLNPLRDLGTFSHWINDKMTHGIKILIMGVDVRRWMDRIKKPWSNSWKKSYPITIWPAVVATDGSTCVDELKRLKRAAIEDQNQCMCDDIDHTMELIQIMLGISDMVESRLICPTSSLTGNNMGSDNWSRYRCDDMQMNGIRIMLLAEYVSMFGTTALEVSHYNHKSQDELRKNDMFLVEARGRCSNEPTYTFDRTTTYAVPWYDPNSNRIGETIAHPTTNAMPDRDDNEDVIEITIKVPIILTNLTAYTVNRRFLARVPFPDALQ